MVRKKMFGLLAAALMTLTATPAIAADLDTTWGTSGVASITVPAGTTAADSTPLADGRVVVVGRGPGLLGTPWGGIVSADGSTFSAFSGAMPADAEFTAVTASGSTIYAVGRAEVGLGVSAFVKVLNSSGVVTNSHTFVVAEETVPTSVAVDGTGQVFIAGSGRGDDDGSEQAWVVRATASGAIDAAFPTLLLEPPFSPFVDPVAYVGVSEGQAVAVVVGNDDPGPGSSTGFHRVTATGSVFMADFSSTRTIVDADLDSSSGRAVFGSLAPGLTLTVVHPFIHTIGVTGVAETTVLGNWIDSAGRLEVARTRPGALLGAGEADVNTFIEAIQTTTNFGTHSDAELVDIATAAADGSVYVTMDSAVGNDLLIAKYSGDPSGRFLDDDTSVHQSDIETFAALGITRGCNPPVNDEFCPTANVTRGQMAAFLARALSLPASSTDFFVDDNSSTFESDINAIAAAGITLGCNPPTNDRYCPSDTVTRGQMAAFLRRGFDLPPSATDFFIDDGGIFEADINAIAAAGITLGCNPPTNDRYCPTTNVTRAQMASFIVRATSG